MPFLNSDEKTIVYEVLRTEYDIPEDIARNYVERYIRPEDEILRLTSKAIAHTIQGVV